MSLPGTAIPVTRPKRVRVHFLTCSLEDEGGAFEEREMELDGLFATCMQHEMDHLDGILAVDYLSDEERHVIVADLARRYGKEFVIPDMPVQI